MQNERAETMKQRAWKKKAKNSFERVTHWGRDLWRKDNNWNYLFWGGVF